MRKFTDKEIELCKKIAEKDRQKLKCGDYMVVNGEVDLFDTKWGECPNRFPDAPAVYNCSTDMYHKIYFPLWQEHDCLEWLRDQAFQLSGIVLTKEKNSKGWLYNFGYWKEDCHVSNFDNKQGKTPLEALLRAVLAVMEGVE